MIEPIVRDAAAWIWANRDAPDWWTPLALTGQNPDPSNPQLPRSKAFQVFTILEDRRLILPISVSSGNGSEFPAYKINFNKEKEWVSLAAKTSFWSLYFVPTVCWLWKKSWLLVIAAIALILTSFGQAFFTKAGEATFELFFPQSNESKTEQVVPPNGP